MFFAPFAVFFELDFSLNFLFILTRIVIKPFAGRAFHTYEIF